MRRSGLKRPARVFGVALSGLGDRLEFSRFVPAREWGVGRGVGEVVFVFSRALPREKQPLTP